MLREAMQCPESPHEIHGMDADDLAVGEELRQSIQRDPVVAVVERRHEHDAVGDVEVGVARRQPLAVHDDRPRERKRHDLQWAGAAVATHRAVRAVKAKAIGERVNMVAACARWLRSTQCACTKPATVVNKSRGAKNGPTVTRVTKRA